MPTARALRRHAGGPRARLLAVLTAFATCLVLAAGHPARAAAAATGCSALDFGTGSAAPLYPSCFQGADGDQLDPDGAGPGLDWQSVIGHGAVVAGDGTGAGDVVFQNGSKEEDPAGWGLTLQSAPAKSDVLSAATSTDQLTHDLFLYLGFTRLGDTGSVDLSFELNQLSPGTAASPTYRSATLPDGTPVALPARSTGDLLLSFDTNGAVVTIGACRWSGTASSGRWNLLDGTPLDSTADKACTPLNTVVSPSAQGAVNSSAIPAWADYIDGIDLAPSQFGELSVDLTRALAAAGEASPCFDFGSAWLHSRSSNQVSSDPKDIVLPRPIVVAGCTVSGTKFHDHNADGVREAGDEGLAGFHMYVDYNGDGTREAGEPEAVTDADGHYTIRDVADGTYDVREVQQAGWTCSYPATGCAHPVAFTGGNVSGQDFGNFRPATLVVAKRTDPSPSTDGFSFSGTGGIGTFRLGDGDQSTLRLAPGSYTVTEGAADHWNATSIGCDDGTAGDLATRAVTVTVGSGDSVTCRFVNTHTATISFAKHVVSGTHPDATFAFTSATAGLGATLGDGQSHSLEVSDFGRTYSVAETEPAGWDVTGLACDAHATADPDHGTVTFAPQPGDAIRCDFTNTERAHLSLTKTEAGGPPTRSWDFRLTGPGGVDQTLTAGPGNGGHVSFDAVAPGAYTLCELALPAGWHTSLGATRADGSACHDYALSAGQALTALADNLHPLISVLKEQRVGSAAFTHDPIDAHVGDRIDYRVTVTNTGDAPLAVTPADARCDSGTLSGPAGVDLARDRLPAGESWVFTCSHLVDGAEASDAFQNTFRATGVDSLGGADGTVSDQSTVDASILKPGVSVLKEQRVGQAQFTHDDVAAHAGETVDYRITVANTGNTGLLVDLSDDRCSGLTPPDGVDPAHDRLPAGRSWVWTCTHLVASGEGPDHVNTAQASGTDALGERVGDHSTVTAHILDPRVLVLKTGPEWAYHGDTLTYRFTVSDAGSAPLHSVSVADDHCPSVSADPVERIDDNGNGTLDPVGADGSSPELWIYQCTMAVPDHRAGEENPIVNTATATALDQTGRQVTATATHSTTILHPQVAIAKSGPATALAGSAVTYDLLVTDPGDEPFAAPYVAVSDPLCEAPPALALKARGSAADPTPDSLDPGDSWLYTCTVRTTVGQAEVDNTATVTGTDAHGRTVGAQAAARTALARPVIQVEPVPAVSAQLTGPSGCVGRGFAVTVRGRSIARVAFYLDGHRVRVLTRPDSGSRYVLRVDPARLGSGVHRVRAVVTFVAAAKVRPRTLRMAFQRCPRRTAPAFSG